MAHVNRLNVPTVQRTHSMWLGAYLGSQTRYVITEPDGESDVHLQIGPEDAADSHSQFLTKPQARALGLILLEAGRE